MKKLTILSTVLIFMFSCSQKPEKIMLKALLLTGNDHPAHKWEETTPAITNILESDSSIEISITRNPDRLAALDTDSYDFLILNYCNWEDPEGISEAAKKGLLGFLEDGGGLMVLHFSNGAFHSSLPGAGESDWPEYRNIVHQVWDHNAESTHDDYGNFKVNMSKTTHYITEGIKDFETKDELYFNQVGEEELPALYTAISIKSGKEEPLAWAYSYKNARVFQSLLGHSAESYKPLEYQEILKRAALWVCGRE